jgi:competence protein ComGC
VEAAMGFSLLEISIVMAGISLLGFLIADNVA